VKPRPVAPAKPVAAATPVSSANTSPSISRAAVSPATAQQKAPAKVTPLPARPAASATAIKPVASVAGPKVQGSLALADQVFTDDVNEEVLELRDKVQKLEVESQVKVGVAEFKAEFMSDVLSDMKLMDHQITQILSKINAKHPDSKNEVMMIKKLLTDFVAKKRK
jgi:hypothetical protein